jgi:hypothetical protein
MQADRTLSSDFGTLSLFRGAIIGCYTCHNGPNDTSRNTNAAPSVSIVSGSTLNNTPLNLTVLVTPAAATLRIISQPANGSLGVSNSVLTYFPNAGFAGSETFTYAAWDGSKNSSLATGTVSVAQGPYSLGIVSHVATNAPAGWPVAFAVVPTVTNHSGTVTFNWNFGDGSAGVTNQFAQHAFAVPGIYSWQVVGMVGTASATNAGSIVITAPVVLAMVAPQNSPNSSLNLAWPSALPDAVVEQSTNLGAGAQWTVVTNLPVAGPVNSSVNLPVAGGNRFFRLRQPW